MERRRKVGGGGGGGGRGDRKINAISHSQGSLIGKKKNKSKRNEVFLAQFSSLNSYFVIFPLVIIFTLI